MKEDRIKNAELLHDLGTNISMIPGTCRVNTARGKFVGLWNCLYLCFHGDLSILTKIECKR